MQQSSPSCLVGLPLVSVTVGLHVTNEINNNNNSIVSGAFQSGCEHSVQNPKGRAGGVAQADRLRHLAAPEGKADFQAWAVAPGRTLLEAMQEFPSAKPPLGASLLPTHAPLPRLPELIVAAALQPRSACAAARTSLAPCLLLHLCPTVLLVKLPNLSTVGPQARTNEPRKWF